MAKGISQKEAEETALKELDKMGWGMGWKAFYKTSGRVNWVFKFKGGGFPVEKRYLVWVNRTDGQISKFAQLE